MTGKGTGTGAGCTREVEDNAYGLFIRLRNEELLVVLGALGVCDCDCGSDSDDWY